jgi:hypothetical protein
MLVSACFVISAHRYRFSPNFFHRDGFNSYTWPGTKPSTKEQEQHLGWLALIRKIHVLMKPS